MACEGSAAPGRSAANIAAGWLLLVLAATGSGCGTVQQNSATEQLLASDAVDTAVSQIDFTPLTSQKVYLDTRYVSKPEHLKAIGAVSGDYIISSIRQAMTGSGVLLMDKMEEADYIVEARVGTLGADGHEMVYGIPSSGALTAASTAVAAATQTPAAFVIPEISIAKNKNQLAAAKVACFAYHRESRERVWQSGLSTAKSTAKDSWVMGAGPFQKGTIYERTGLAGSTLHVGEEGFGGQSLGFREPITFELPPVKEVEEDEVITAGAESPATETVETPAETPAQ
ncbi:MAG: hypothetical protein KF774_14725 [Planctomyces sp.]|nr:hypothetical protein [Planctomyces sp.]